jgi:hypothetical protein
MGCLIQSIINGNQIRSLDFFEIFFNQFHAEIHEGCEDPDDNKVNSSDNMERRFLTQSVIDFR